MCCQQRSVPDEIVVFLLQKARLADYCRIGFEAPMGPHHPRTAASHQKVLIALMVEDSSVRIAVKRLKRTNIMACEPPLWWPDWPVSRHRCSLLGLSNGRRSLALACSTIDTKNVDA